MVVATTYSRPPNDASHVKVTMAEVTPDSEQWQKDLATNGWAIVKGVITPEKAAEYASKANDWLEGFNLGYKRDDKSTWRKENVPRHNRGGLYSAYSIGHAQFVWDLKGERKVVEAFEKIWGTDKLTVSFDGGNFSLPLQPDEIETGAKPWPHTDQSPNKQQLECVQGLINLLPNGPKDGGLAVIDKSFTLFNEIWAAFDHDKPEGGWSDIDFIAFDEAKVKWLEERGAKVIKPNLDPGDFILWDSRTVHWGQSPTGTDPRFAVYICYKPDAWMSEEARARKIDAFEKGYSTTHDPCTFSVKTVSYEDWNQTFPYGRPVLTEQLKKAVGLVRY